MCSTLCVEEFDGKLSNGRPAGVGGEKGVDNLGFQLPSGDIGGAGEGDIQMDREKENIQMVYRVGDNPRPDLALLYGLQVKLLETGVRDTTVFVALINRLQRVCSLVDLSLVFLEANTNIVLVRVLIIMNVSVLLHCGPFKSWFCPKCLLTLSVFKTAFDLYNYVNICS